MEALPEINEQKQAPKNYDETKLKIKGYTIGIKHKFLPVYKKHKCYRHEVITTGHLVLYRNDKSLAALPMTKLSWILYPDYWDFMAQFPKPAKGIEDGGGRNLVEVRPQQVE
jgi:hypothetical protein